ncbi:hypothetical protein B0A52_06265 [Exophiala mesophila]|uniref:Uncharacterized protein n=1 Tax=Exophiala mesophila TaxID=212818 RepID=A0A438N320_EXOME|nr:hypothetical protein B0A52_06265 [Exophiala mesophila]
MATPRRRSARLSKSAQQKHSSPRKVPSSAHLELLVERDETPEANQPRSIENVLSTPASPTSVKSHLSKLSKLKTPQTMPRVDRGEMHPQLMHHSTAKAPDSGLKLGFVDLPSQAPRSIASAQNTPSKYRMSTPVNLSSTKFSFNFGADAQLSTEAQELMDTVREEAAKIKAQMQAEKEAQQKKDDEAEAAYGGTNASGRRIVKPKGKVGRFSDIHMAQFKKMDSIADHPSSFRSKPGFAQPTTMSLKRSGSKAGLDEVERPRTAGKGTPGRLPPPFLGRPTSVSPFKSIPQVSDRIEVTGSAKRARQSEFHDVSASRPAEQQSPAKSNLPRPVPSSLLSPTKASLARSAGPSQLPVVSPLKSHYLSRTASVKSLRTTSSIPTTRPPSSQGSGSTKTIDAVSTKSIFERQSPKKGIAPPSETVKQSSSESYKPAEVTTTNTKTVSTSKLPMLTGLKSILRHGRKSNAAPSIENRPGTPKRPNTATADSGSVRKVDFTPSVKSRYAVKLAAGSPSPAKMSHLTPGKPPVVPYDPAAYTMQDDDGDENWEDAESEIDYPQLPPLGSSPAAQEMGKSFDIKAKEHNRRESKEFKSIFTTLHHPSRPSTLTSVNTTVNQTGPTIHANKIMRSPSNPHMSKPSPNTIRRVQGSGATEIVQPFEDAHVKTMPHGLPGKKRRRESTLSDDDDFGPEDKENRRMSIMPKVPGGWEDSLKLDEVDDEGVKRGGKRAKFVPEEATPAAMPPTNEKKKPRASSAREMAKQNAKDRKGKGILSLSRLNMLSRPKQRS